MEVFDYLMQWRRLCRLRLIRPISTALLGGPPEDQTVALSGITRLAKTTYATYFSGYSNVIAFNGSPVQTESVVESDFCWRRAKNRSSIWHRMHWLICKPLFLDLATTSLDGETIANADVSALTGRIIHSARTRRHGQNYSTHGQRCGSGK